MKQLTLRVKLLKIFNPQGLCGFAMINLSLKRGKNISTLCTLRTRRTGREEKI
jgi:hypothetical protein